MTAPSWTSPASPCPTWASWATATPAACSATTAWPSRPRAAACSACSTRPSTTAPTSPPRSRAPTAAPARTAKAACGSRPARPSAPPPPAVVRLAAAPVRWHGPKNARGEHGQEPLPVWVVYAGEVDPPAGRQPVEWVLLTDVPVRTYEDLVERVGWYEARWLVEELHKG